MDDTWELINHPMSDETGQALADQMKLQNEILKSIAHRWKIGRRESGRRFDFAEPDYYGGCRKQSDHYGWNRHHYGYGGRGRCIPYGVTSHRAMDGEGGAE